MKLTPIKVLVTTLSPQDQEAWEQYEVQMSELSDDVVRSSLPKPSIPEGRYQNKWYNMDQYIILSWSPDWDSVRDVPMIIAQLHCITSNTTEHINANYKESDWMKLLSQLGYSHHE